LQVHGPLLGFWILLFSLPPRRKPALCPGWEQVDRPSGPPGTNLCRLARKKGDLRVRCEKVWRGLQSMAINIDIVPQYQIKAI
jgi:hypothetical protein